MFERESVFVRKRLELVHGLLQSNAFYIETRFIGNASYRRLCTVDANMRLIRRHIRYTTRTLLRVVKPRFVINHQIHRTGGRFLLGRSRPRPKFCACSRYGRGSAIFRRCCCCWNRLSSVLMDREGSKYVLTLTQAVLKTNVVF